MSMLKVQGVELTADTLEKVVFDVEGLEFLVKNFNDFDIYVSFEDTTEEGTVNTSKMIKIPGKNAQVCVINKSSALQYNSSRCVYIYAEDDGEVEVQCIKY